MAFYARALRRFPRKALNISIHESRQKPLYFFMLTRQNSSDTILSPAESAKKYNWKCRQDLATAFRGLDMYGLSEGVCTHLTMMAPALNGNGDVMLMIPYGLHWSQVCCSFCALCGRPLRPKIQEFQIVQTKYSSCVGYEIAQTLNS